LSAWPAEKHKMVDNTHSHSIAEYWIFGHLLAFLIQSMAALYRAWQNDWYRQGNASTIWDKSDRHPDPD